MGSGGPAAARTSGCPAPTCAACGAAGAGRRRRDGWQPPSRHWSTTSPTPRSPSTRTAPGDLEDFERAHRRGVQPRRARLRRRRRRHPAHVADAVLHRLAVGHLDRPAAAHRARRLELPAAALDAHLRLRRRLRRRRLARRRHARAQCGIRPTAARRRRAATTRPRAGCPPWGSLFEVEPARGVALGALKAVGNPTAARQRPARRRRRRHRAPAGRNARPDNGRRRPLGPAQPVGTAAARPARAAHRRRRPTG